jgi:hypothetical protein
MNCGVCIVSLCALALVGCWAPATDKDEYSSRCGLSGKSRKAMVNQTEAIHLPGWWDELFSNIARFPGYFFE